VLFFRKQQISHLAKANAVSNDLLVAMGGLLLGGATPPSLSTDARALIELQDLGSVVPVVIYNSLAWSRSSVVEVPVGRSDLRVMDAGGDVIPSQVCGVLCVC